MIGSNRLAMACPLLAEIAQWWKWGNHEPYIHILQP